jgi:phenylpyruvate tautomerase PptA (4-oxalocrotonate tautomerase family)
VRKPRKILTVDVFAASNAEAEQLVDQLARAACDIANSASERASLIVTEAAPEVVATSPYLNRPRRTLAQAKADIARRLD